MMHANNVIFVKWALLFLVLLVCRGTSRAVVQQTFTITEPFDLNWPAIGWTIRSHCRGEVMPEGVGLRDAAGTPVAVQLSNITYWPDRKTVKTATVSFMAALQPDEAARWTLIAGTKQ